MSGNLRRLLLVGLLAGLALAQRRQPDTAHLYRLNAGDGRLKAHWKFENLYQGHSSRGIEVLGNPFRGPCLDFGNLTVWNSRPVLLGDRVLYPLPHQREPMAHPFWVVDSDGLTPARWMTGEQAGQLRRRDSRRLASLRSGTRFNGLRRPDGTLAFPDGWVLSPDGSLRRRGWRVPGRFRQLTTGGRFPNITYQPELAAASHFLLCRREGQLTCFDAQSRRLLWTRPCSQPLRAAWSFAHELYVLLEPDLARLDPADGRPLWSRRLEGEDASLFRTHEALWVVTEQPTL